jgi:MFS family permease
MYNVSNVLMGLGYFFPSLYLPSYATTVGLSTVHGALLLTVMSCSQVAGQFTFGYLSDRRVPVDVLITVSLLVASVATLTSWGLSHSLAPLVVFALLYGFFGAGYTALWARMVTAISAEPTASQTIFGIFCAGKGVGNVLAGPVGAGLLGATAGDGVRKTRGFGYGAIKYEAVVLFTGACLLLSAATLGVKCVKPGVFRMRWLNTWVN